MIKRGNERCGVWVEDFASVLSTMPHPVAQSPCEQSPKGSAQHPAIGIMPALSIRQCDVAGTHKASNNRAIAVTYGRIRSDAIARRARTSNEVTSYRYHVVTKPLGSRDNLESEIAVGDMRVHGGHVPNHLIYAWRQVRSQGDMK